MHLRGCSAAATCQEHAARAQFLIRVRCIVTSAWRAHQLAGCEEKKTCSSREAACAFVVTVSLRTFSRTKNAPFLEKLELRLARSDWAKLLSLMETARRKVARLPIREAAD